MYSLIYKTLKIKETPVGVRQKRSIEEKLRRKKYRLFKGE